MRLFRARFPDGRVEVVEAEKASDVFRMFEDEIVKSIVEVFR